MLVKMYFFSMNDVLDGEKAVSFAAISTQI